MKRNAVGHSLAMALAAAAAGVALCASPVRADEQLALAPLSDSLSQAKLFARQPMPASGSQPSAAQPSAVQPSAGDQGDGDHEKKECRYDWRYHNVQLQENPIGYVIGHGLTLANLFSNGPAGFPLDYNNYLVTPTFGLGGGTEVGISATFSEALLKPGLATFYGGAIQKQLVRESRGAPNISLGVRGNIGPNAQSTIGAWLVGTKKVAGGECGKSAIYITGGVKYLHYNTDRDLSNQTPRTRTPLPQDSSGVRPFGGINLAFTNRLTASAEIEAPMPWQWNTPYTIRGQYLVWRGLGVQGGIRNTGYITHGFVGLVFGSVTGRGSNI